MNKIKSFKHFLSSTKAELRKVHWLKRKELFQSTFIVLAVAVFFTCFFAGTDWLITQAFSIFK